MDKDTKDYIIKTLRFAFLKSKVRSDFLRNSKIDKGRWQCATCSAVVDRKGINVDHVNPVISLTDSENSLNEIINRLYCGKLQTLCIKCHSSKTSSENIQRPKKRKKDARSWYEINGIDI